MGLVTDTADEAHFQQELENAGNKLVIVNFMASWSKSCQLIYPFYEQMSQKYPNAKFIKVDVDQCQETAATQLVSVMPTFYLFRNMVKIDSLQGANSNKLEEKIKRYYDPASSIDLIEDVGVSGQIDLGKFILTCKCEGVTEDTIENLLNCFGSSGGQLDSSDDEHMLLSIWFSQPVNIFAIKVVAPIDRGPKKIKLFANQLRELSFDSASAYHATQDVDIEPADLEGTQINLISHSFRNVQSLQIFILENQTDAEITQLDNIQLFGTLTFPGSLSDTKRFKK